MSTLVRNVQSAPCGERVCYFLRYSSLHRTFNSQFSLRRLAILLLLAFSCALLEVRQLPRRFPSGVVEPAGEDAPLLVLWLILVEVTPVLILPTGMAYAEGTGGAYSRVFLPWVEIWIPWALHNGA